MEQPVKNTDTELFREKEGDYYSPSLHKTEHGKIGIDVGGTVYIKSLREWHKLAEQSQETRPHETTVMCELTMTVKVNRNGIFKYLERNGFLKPKKEMIAINLDTLSVMGSSENPPATYRHLQINKLAT